MNVLHRLRAAFAAATPPGGDAAAFAAAVRPSGDPKFGDYQANGCMAIANAVGAKPRDVAESVRQAVDLAPLADKPEVAGPGFLNVRLREDWLSQALGDLLTDESLGIPAPGQVETIVIDYSSPNVAKPMHVGHIRSTVIGDSLARVLAAVGHRVVRDNHLGDWGLQFGMIIHGWKTQGNEEAFEKDPIAELVRLYRLVSGPIESKDKYRAEYEQVFKLEAEGRKADAEALFNNLYDGSGLTLDDVRNVIADGRAMEAAAQAETAKLHAGDPINRSLWQRFIRYCLPPLEAIYERLGIHFDSQHGESFYDPMLADVVRELEAAGLAVESQGATVVFVESTKAPFIVRKRDGAFNYATTDLATIKYRHEKWHPDKILYVVDHRQGEHFKALFEVARRWGYDGIDFQHISFGTILGFDRRPFRTREGDVVGLESLLDEAVARARRVVDENSPELSEEERRRAAEVVGLGAIKYADLSQNRASDYVFDWDKMMALTGNTATYMQYAYARIQSIFRKGGTMPEAIRRQRPAILLSHPAERALAVRVLRLPEVLELAAAELKPNILTDYLFALANEYSTFYENCPVLKAESPERRDSRLALCDLTARSIRFGMGLLGIEVLDRM
jgi:arginyl-tRNA synthetase